MSGIWNLNLYRDLLVAFTGIVPDLPLVQVHHTGLFHWEGRAGTEMFLISCLFLKILHNRISSNLLNAMDLSFNYQPPDNDITD